MIVRRLAGLSGSGVAPPTVEVLPHCARCRVPILQPSAQRQILPLWRPLERVHQSVALALAYSVTPRRFLSGAGNDLAGADDFEKGLKNLVAFGVRERRAKGAVNAFGHLSMSLQVKAERRQR